MFETDTLKVFRKEIFEKVNFEKNQQTTKYHEKFPSMQRDKSPINSYGHMETRSHLTLNLSDGGLNM